MKIKNMSPTNIYMIVTYLETKYNRDLTDEEHWLIEDFLSENYELYEYPTAEIASLVESKFLRKDGLGFEEALATVKEKEEEGYVSNLYDDGHFDGFLDAVKVIKDLMQYLDRTNLPVYQNFINSMQEINGVYKNLHWGIRKREGIDRVEQALNRKLTQEEHHLLWSDEYIGEEGLYYQPDVYKIIAKYNLEPRADGKSGKDFKNFMTNRINFLNLKLKTMADSLLYDLSRAIKIDKFEYVKDVENFFMSLIEKDARVPTDHQYDRLMNLAKVLIDIPVDVLIRHYESIMEDEPLKDR